jgi:hypothetical protein
VVFFMLWHAHALIYDLGYKLDALRHDTRLTQTH